MSSLELLAFNVDQLDKAAAAKPKKAAATATKKVAAKK